MAKEPKTKRERKSPQQRAQQALDVASRRVETLQKRLDKAASEVETLTTERDAAVAHRDYLAQNPALIPPQEPAPVEQPVA